MAEINSSNIPSSHNSDIITCETCDYSVAQACGKKRTICPNCGHFYNKDAAEIASSFQRNRTNRPRIEQPRGRNQNVSVYSKNLVLGLNLNV